MDQINHCRACEHKHIKPFFDIGRQPFANGFLVDKTDRNAMHPLSLSWCPECSLVQLNHTADPMELFSHYVWVTSTSSTARVHSVRLCETILQKAGDHDDNSYILEIASNDGTFLKPFIKSGYEVLGIDPAENIVKMALADGVPTKCGFFGQEMAEGIVANHGFPSVVIARNVLPHVANLNTFVKGICKCMSDDSLLVLEVHYAKSILEELHYDSIYHEHLCYFSLKSLEGLLNKYGLHIHDIMESPISGGSIVVFARLAQCEKTSTLHEYEEKEEALNINELARWKRFAETAYVHRKLFVDLLDEDLAKGRKIVGYGASARSSTMLNFCDVGVEKINMIADQNPMKQKLFTPGTHIPIDNPETVMATNPDTVAILAWNFLDEIAKEIWTRFNFQGKLVIPFPYPPKSATIQEVVNA